MRKLSLGLIFFVVTSCSTQKNRFVNRQYHRLTTAYNVLFNGEEAYKVGKSILDASVEDNFFELLEVEPITLSGEDINNTTLVPGFDRAEEKAVKAIQKHSMRFEGVQRNDQIDQAYLLLGKARYYDRRFFPALEAFNYLLESYGSQQAYIEGLIWREKTNIQLLNNEIAVSNLRPLARKLLTKNKFFSTANATLAQAFINLRQYDSAQYYISKAAQFEKRKKDQGRYYYILGQLNENAGRNDAALTAFENVLELKKKTERKYWVHAKIKQQLLLAQRDSLDPKQNLMSLLRKYENRAFTHVVYRALGTYYLNQSNDSLAQVYFSASQKEPSLDEPTQRANYRDLADYYFSQGAYEKTGAYLDSLIPLLDRNPLTQKRTQRERTNLEGILKYENAIQTTDSLLTLLSLSKEEQQAYFQKYLEDKKKNVIEIVANNLASNKKQRLFESNKKTNFYFYKPNLVAQGKQSFLASWGNRPNVDNWRSAERLVTPINPNQKQEKAEPLVNIALEDLSTLMAQVPTGEEKDSLTRLNHQSYLQAGLLYKEQFDNLDLATKRLEQLLAKDPEPKEASAALYHLFRIAERQSDVKAGQYKSNLIYNYSESPFAQLLTNPDFQEQDDASTPELQYQKLLKAFQNNDFVKAKALGETLSVLLSASDWAPKIALIQAHITGKLLGKKQWKEELEAVRKQYPQSDTAKYINTIVNQLESSNTAKTKPFALYKWVIPFRNQDSLGIARNKQQLETLINKQKELFLSVDPYDNAYQFLVVHGFQTLNSVQQFEKKLEVFEQNDFNKAESFNFVVLSKDYQQIQLNKTWFPSHKKERP